MDIIFWLSAIIYALLFLSLLYFVYKNIMLRKFIADNSVEYLQLKYEMQLKVDTLRKELEKRDNAAVEKTDGFLKFLSESRDWAFQYIEDVQHAIFVLKEKYDDKEDMDESLKELFNMLPDNKENKNG